MSAASLKQAQSASEAAKTILEKGDASKEKSKVEAELKEKLETATTQLAVSEKGNDDLIG